MVTYLNSELASSSELASHLGILIISASQALGCRCADPLFCAGDLTRVLTVVAASAPPTTIFLTPLHDFFLKGYVADCNKDAFVLVKKEGKHHVGS